MQMRVWPSKCKWCLNYFTLKGPRWWCVCVGGCKLGVKTVLIYSCPDPIPAPLYHHVWNSTSGTSSVCAKNKRRAHDDQSCGLLRQEVRMFIIFMPEHMKDCSHTVFSCCNSLVCVFNNSLWCTMRALKYSTILVYCGSHLIKLPAHSRKQTTWRFIIII